MKVPDESKVIEYLEAANVKNPGLWKEHSYKVGEAARYIAREHPMLDEKVAYALGCLHDIGRFEGYSQMHHIISGYQYMMAEGFEAVAKICLTHSFPIPKLEAYIGEKDCTKEELIFVDKFLHEVEYTEYDLLIQLCDSLALPNKFCIVEKRFVDVTIRHGFNEYNR